MRLGEEEEEGGGRRVWCRPPQSSGEEVWCTPFFLVFFHTRTATELIVQQPQEAECFGGEINEDFQIPSFFLLTLLP